MGRRREIKIDAIGNVCGIQTTTRIHGDRWIYRDKIIQIMEKITPEEKGRRDKHYHGIYAVHPKNKTCHGVKRILEDYFGDNNFSTSQGEDWLRDLRFEIDVDTTIAKPRQDVDKNNKPR